MISCDQARAAVLARLDGVEPLFRGPGITDHLDACSDCRAWEAELLAHHQRERRRDHPAGHAALPSLESDGPEPLRYVLGAVAGTEVILAAADLLGANVHPFRELAGTDLAFAVGCLVAAIQPRRSLGLLPVAVALALLIVGTGVLDLVRGIAQPLSEAHHLLEVTGAVALVMLARRSRQTSTAT